MDLAQELAQYGPDAPARAIPTPLEAERYCWKLATSHYENFSVVSLLAPKRLRLPLAAIYGYCRWADDLADETDNAETSLRLLSWWEAQTVALDAPGAKPTHPVFVMLAEMRQTFSISTKSLLDLLTAFRQDQRQTRYATRDELLEYCRYSANPVGRLVLGLAGADSAENVQLSDEICTGLQLANFAQDVARDFAKGRIYLPASEYQAVGLTEADFGQPGKAECWRQVIQQQVSRAREHFTQGNTLPQGVPPELRPAIGLFIAGGNAILDAIERQNFDVWRCRPKLSRFQKGMLLAQVAWQSLWRR